MKRLVLALALLATLPAFALAADAPPRPRGVHFIYLIRHGMYDPDTVQTDDRLGSALNALGHEQAKLVGQRLAGLPVKFHALVSSDFTRARETADDIGAILHMAPVRDSLIHECTPTADRDDWMRNHSAADIALCESNLQAAWAKYFVATPDADTHDLLVSHGNVTRWLVARTLGMDPKTWSKFDIANCSLTIIAVRPDGVARLVTFSDSGHIPVAKQTWTGRGPGWDPKTAVGGAGMK
jgi:serine/threonine-protein phosphatase PGAM5